MDSDLSLPFPELPPGRYPGARWQTILLSLALALPGCSGRAERPGTPPRHLLLITVEHARRDHVTALGYQRNTTGLLKLNQPYVLDIDYLGVEGISFANAFVPSSDNRISVAALMAGRLPQSGGAVMVDGPLVEDPSTLAEDFRAAGFATGGFVNRTSLSDAQCTAEYLGRGFERTEFATSDVGMLGAAVGWLEDVTTTAEGEVPTPVFLWLHFAGIRPPFEGEPMSDSYSVEDYEGPVRSEAAFFEDLRAGSVELGSIDHARLRDMYDGRLTRVSQLLNSFFFLYRNTIGSGMLWEDSLIVLVGSSGCELAEREGRVATPDSLHGAGLSVPLQFWHPPSLTGERIFGTVVELTDLSATLRDWFQVGSRGVGSGQSLLALIDSYVQRDFERRGAFSVSCEGERVRGTTLRTERWRLVLEGDEQRLYDLEIDPGEHHDVSIQFPDVVEELRLRLDRRLQGLDS